MTARAPYLYPTIAGALGTTVALLAGASGPMTVLVAAIAFGVGMAAHRWY